MMNDSQYITFWVQALPKYTNTLGIDGIEWRLIPLSSFCSPHPLERYKNLAECYVNLNMGNFEGLSAFVDFHKLEKSLYNDIFEKGAPNAWQINLDFSEFEVDSESGFSLFPLIAGSYTDISRLDSQSDWWKGIQKEMKKLNFSHEKIEKAKEEFFAIKWPIFSAEAIRDNLFQDRFPADLNAEGNPNTKDEDEEFQRKSEEYDEIIKTLKTGLVLTKEEGDNITCPEPNYVPLATYVNENKGPKEVLSRRTKEGLAVARAKGRVGGRREKLTHEQKMDIIDNVRSYRKSANQMARLYNVSRSTIYRILSKKGS